MSKSPILAQHRRNRIDQLAALPKGCWIEIDLDVHEGSLYVIHDPMTAHPAKTDSAPDRFDAFLPAALKAGVGGFIVDCKRENVEKFVQPLLDQYKVKNYFYLNEMEVQADIFMEKSAAHPSGVRIWKYRGAEDVLRYARDMKAAGMAFPTWAWVDCWQHGLLQDIQNAFLPIDGKQAQDLQAAGVQLCICSPELYVHQYGKDYTPEELTVFEKGIAAYRQKLAAQNIAADMVCTKFPAWWGIETARLAA